MTRVPPVDGPVAGETEIVVGMAAYVKVISPSRSTPLLETESDTSPTDEAGATHFISVADIKVAATTWSPKEHFSRGELEYGADGSVLIVTSVPPLALPMLG